MSNFSAAAPADVLRLAKENRISMLETELQLKERQLEKVQRQNTLFKRALKTLADDRNELLEMLANSSADEVGVSDDAEQLAFDTYVSGWRAANEPVNRSSTFKAFTWLIIVIFLALLAMVIIKRFSSYQFGLFDKALHTGRSVIAFINNINNV
ncbi:hypothetical protein VNI00_012716 [Paramarasmius palmivorus]|uniref:Uncharacterized protein n=1 Tax=Paramarasmius palmivorus TaxID=297713 RepID=A0AAW0C2U6_9AGAR